MRAMDDTHALPDDPAECDRLLLSAYQQAQELQQQVAASARKVETLHRVLDQTADSYARLQQEHAARLEELAWYRRWVHGRRRERHVDADGQLHLFALTPGGDGPEATPDSAEPRQQVAGHTRRRRRELDLSRLPHHRHESDLSPGEKICSGCGCEKDRIGEDITRILEHVPSTLEVHEHVRPKYACRYCKDSVSSPPPPERPIARGIAGPGLIAQIVVSKFGDHLPLYRQEDIFVRHGLHIARSTLCDWVRAAAELLRPLYDLQRERVIQSSVMWTDDTPVKVLVRGEEGSHLGRFWTYVGDEQHPYSVYDFTMSRSRDGPRQFLHGFRGYLHADAYAGYDAIYLGPESRVVEVACWAHARRKFYEARQNYPREAHQVLEWIQQLYDIEDRAGSLPVTHGSKRCSPTAGPPRIRSSSWHTASKSHAPRPPPNATGDGDDEPSPDNSADDTSYGPTERLPFVHPVIATGAVFESAKKCSGERDRTQFARCAGAPRFVDPTRCHQATPTAIPTRVLTWDQPTERQRAAKAQPCRWT
jgi:transposase